MPNFKIYDRFTGVPDIGETEQNISRATVPLRLRLRKSDVKGIALNFLFVTHLREAERKSEPERARGSGCCLPFASENSVSHRF